MSRSCLSNLGFFTTVSVCGTAVASGTAAAGASLGGVILNSAGWTASGVKIISIATLAGSAAAGAAVIVGPLACCAAGVLTLTGSNTHRRTGSATTTASSIWGTTELVLSAAFGAAGAGMLGLSKLQVGYAAAATATGTTILVLGIACVAGIAIGGGVCGYALCCNDRRQSTLGQPYPERRYFAEPTHRAPDDVHLYMAPVDENGVVNTSIQMPVVDASGKPMTVLDMERLAVQHSIFPNDQVSAPSMTFEMT